MNKCVNCGGECSRGACVWCQDWRLRSAGKPWSEEQYAHAMEIETKELGHKPVPSGYWKHVA